MKIEDIEMLESYIKTGICPLLIEGIPEKILKKGIIIESNCNISDLTGHYQGNNYVPPEWYKKLEEKSKNSYCLLVIKDLNEISEKEQLKFKRILKEKSIGVTGEFELPENCAIIVTCSNLKEKPIDKTIYTLLAHIN